MHYALQDFVLLLPALHDCFGALLADAERCIMHRRLSFCKFLPYKLPSQNTIALSRRSLHSVHTITGNLVHQQFLYEAAMPMRAIPCGGRFNTRKLGKVAREDERWEPLRSEP
jgi:hypothetical protein